MNVVTRQGCPFCRTGDAQPLFDNHLAFSIPDAFPVSEGHALIIPKRHIVSLFDATPEEITALHILMSRVREHLCSVYHPDGFNIGINDGEAAGQTVMHLHIHLIPRYRGDVADPRGGVRWINPLKADYWSF